MKTAFFLATASILIALPGSVQAQCCGTGWTQVNSTGSNNINALLAGKTVCAVLGSDRWQEYHNPNGTLRDYKKGPTDPVDPSADVGIWSSINSGANSKIRYTYGSNVYEYQVCRLLAQTVPTATTVQFCGAQNITASLQSGQGPCP